MTQGHIYFEIVICSDNPQSCFREPVNKGHAILGMILLFIELIVDNLNESTLKNAPNFSAFSTAHADNQGRADRKRFVKHREHIRNQRLCYSAVSPTRKNDVQGTCKFLRGLSRRPTRAERARAFQH